MGDTARKARTSRLRRLQAMLNERLENPLTAVETLVAEVALGELRPADWEALHAAATRDDKERELADAYSRVTALRYWRDLEPRYQSEVLMHAADYFQGVLGDRQNAELFLKRVLEGAPDHFEAFRRLQSTYETAGDKLRLAELYALIARKPPIDPGEAARKALNAIKLLPSKTLLSDEACKRLVALGPASLRLIDAVDDHCRKTNRFELARSVRELALENDALPKTGIIEQREALVRLLTGEAKDPEKAIVHVEELLSHDPTHVAARSAAERLLSSRPVASRAAAALKEARRRRGSTRPRPR